MQQGKDCNQRAPSRRVQRTRSTLSRVPEQVEGGNILGLKSSNLNGKISDGGGMNQARPFLEEG